MVVFVTKIGRLRYSYFHKFFLLPTPRYIGFHLGSALKGFLKLKKNRKNDKIVCETSLTATFTP
jgi:hypothetical protein